MDGSISAVTKELEANAYVEIRDQRVIMEPRDQVR